MNASAASGETLTDVLGARALRTPTDRRVLDGTGGVPVGAAASRARPAGWFPLTAATVGTASFVVLLFALIGVAHGPVAS